MSGMIPEVQAVRNYRDYVRDHFQKHSDKDGFWNPPGTPTPEKPKHGDRWGDWWYSQKNLTLEFHGERDGYEVDLERCNTPAQAMDWIFQIAGKNWATPEVLGHLIQALDDLLEPQANLCSFGHRKTMDVRKHLCTSKSVA
jgi:hypothetical protein